MEKRNLELHFLKKKILLVDDEAPLRELAQTLLHHRGFTLIDQASSGKRALELIKAKPYDIVISDWNMPELDGLALFEKILADDECGHPVFILLTSVSERDKVVEAIKSGIQHYIVKPFTPATLFDQVMDCLVKAAKTELDGDNKS